MIENKDLAAMRALMKGAGGGTGGGTSIDVTAKVGQTIVVKEVDANGKPTAWESADYQPRTHWSEVITILPETTVEIDLELGGAELPYDFILEAGKEYTVIYNGVEYTGVECIDDGEGVLVLGNIGAIEESLPATGHPFILVCEPKSNDENGNLIFAWAVIPLDGATSVTLSIIEEAVTPIPQKYLSNAMPYYIDITGAGTDDDPYVCNDMVANVNAIFESGRPLSVKWKYTENYIIYECRIPCIQRTIGSVTFYLFGLWFNSSTVTNSVFFKLMSQSDGTFAVDRTLSTD